MKKKIPKKSEKIKPLLNDLYTTIKGFYGERLKYLVLYGSYARGNFNENSDIDVLVVLDSISSDIVEISNIAELKNDILLDSDIYISTNPVSIFNFENSDYSFYKNVRKEGIIL